MRKLIPRRTSKGYDSTYKLSILSSLAFHTKVPYTKIYREGITGISQEDIAYGKQLGYTVKLLAIGKNTFEGIEVRVHPTYIKNTNPLATVNDAFNAVFLHGDAVDDIMLYGRGAGALPTGSAIVSDVIYAATHSDVKYSTFKNTANADKEVKFVTNFASSYYLRLTVEDKAGVLSKITAVFGKHNISIINMMQEDADENGRVSLIIVTHETREQNVKNAVSRLNQLDSVKVETVIRVVS